MLKEWDFANCIIKEREFDYDLHKFEIIAKPGYAITLDGEVVEIAEVIPNDLDMMEEIIEGLDEGNNPTDKGWEDGLGKTIGSFKLSEYQELERFEFESTLAREVYNNSDFEIATNGETFALYAGKISRHNLVADDLTAEDIEKTLISGQYDMGYGYVIWDDKAYTLLDHPEYGSYQGRPVYTADAEDIDGGKYNVIWELLPEWVDSGSTDESNACDWDNPIDVYEL